MSWRRGLLFFFVLTSLIFTGQGFAGSNSNALLSLDLITDGGAGNRMDDGVISGTVSGKGNTIAIEVFAASMRTPLIGVVLRFEFDASLLAFVKAGNSAFPLTLPEGSVGTNFATRTPVTLAPSGFLARAEFETVADVTGREFAIGIEMVTLAENTTSSDVLTTTNVITFNATLSPDFDGDGTVGFSDFLQFVRRFGTQSGDAGFEARFDLDADRVIGFSDFLIFAQNFGKEVSSPAARNPDLVVDRPTVSDNALTPGQSFTLSVTVRNRGNGEAVSTELRYYRSLDATISTSDAPVGTDVIGSLTASGAVEESIRLQAPSSAGTYYYGACVEPVSGESDTNNNCSSAVAIAVAPGASPAGASKLYWTDWGTDKIQRANLDGSGIEDLVVGGGLDGPDGLALDVAGGKMYWTDAGANKIQRAGLDGSDVEDLVTGLGIPYGLALDVSGGKMYWTDRQASRIQRSDLDGANVEDLITSGLAFPGELVLDVQRGKMYWTNPGSDKIQRANLDGSQVEDLVTSGLGSPTGLAVDVSGGGRTGARTGYSGLTLMARTWRTWCPAAWTSPMAWRWTCQAGRCTGRTPARTRYSEPTSTDPTSKTSSRAPTDWSIHRAWPWVARRHPSRSKSSSWKAPPATDSARLRRRYSTRPPLVGCRSLPETFRTATSPTIRSTNGTMI